MCTKISLSQGDKVSGKEKAESRKETCEAWCHQDFVLWCLAPKSIIILLARLALGIVRSLWIPRASAALIPAPASHSKEKKSVNSVDSVWNKNLSISNLSTTCHTNGKVKGFYPPPPPFGLPPGPGLNWGVLPSWGTKWHLVIFLKASFATLSQGDKVSRKMKHPVAKRWLQQGVLCLLGMCVGGTTCWAAAPRTPSSPCRGDRAWQWCRRGRKA